MAKSAKTPPPPTETNVLRRPSEVEYAHELAILRASDSEHRPEGWQLSPRAVQKFILGGSVGDISISPKYIGNPRIVEIAIATLTTDRALLLVGEPGTAKSWLSEHLAAAISGDSLQVIQGTAGTTEEQIRYSWNYALLLAEGPSPKALVASPVYRAMAEGKIVRFEEISRVPSEIQDALITILSEKMLMVPELSYHVAAKRGFNVIATANTRDRGVNEMSAALLRRFNKVQLPLPADIESEVAIVRKRVAELGSSLQLPTPPPAAEAVRRIIQIFHELRRGETSDGKQKVKAPSGVLSTAEAISLVSTSMALAGHFGTGQVSERDLAGSLHSVIVKDDDRDRSIWIEYLENVLKKRGDDWQELYQACKDLLK